MKEHVISIRYASALLSLAKSENAIGEVRRSLEHFISIAHSQKGLLTWIADEEIPRQKRLVLVREIAGASAIHPLVAKFIEVLINKDRIKHIYHIAKSFNALADKEEGIVRGTVLTAALADAEAAKQKLENSLGKKLNKKVILTLKEDPSLIGGVLLMIRDKVWDASIKRKLHEIKERLCQ
ncbi:MAG: ATP synthase F1 subunit delta [Deltaproteobacteria bacterium]|nr:ATP synthase F1 subunit delta [Deltaproteobacteria bacterium]MBI2975273.1 ATP synthase F1 subunit delta [Deltaproteobacteria bacterium]